jgi:hypothetical protein
MGRYARTVVESLYVTWDVYASGGSMAGEGDRITVVPLRPARTGVPPVTSTCRRQACRKGSRALRRIRTGVVAPETSVRPPTAFKVGGECR